MMSAGPLSASLRSAPLPRFAGARNHCRDAGTFPAWVLAPGERWFAQQTGEGVFGTRHAAQERYLPVVPKLCR
ncbi:hypothetical protein SAMN04488498_11873 [Mesorhizobium albiziae]|uniref:Uncharacterized protein n=1 Tax=Neomesorhizobium albiziae TaxID=335020 RepID=A0A1I4DN44_9HYPH|nr:hypothetical protein SAMN04488498_11873 [Mesorhizobium albiziae]